MTTNTDASPTSRALIVDDHPIITGALSAALLSLHVFDTVDTEATVGAAAERLGEGAAYDLVMLDLHMGESEDQLSTLQLRERFPEVPMVIFSGDETSEAVAAAFESGVQGYISKSSPMPVVINAIRIVLSGGNYIPPQAARMFGLTERAPRTGNELADSQPLPRLSPRQRQVLHYLLQGLPNKVIGTRLNMADGTVKSHLNTIYRMYAVNSRAQLILKARQLGLI